ncbi:MAG: GNAT family N-acetyltransferase [Scytonematopsis contorta HA4267-MV1]|jgi:predicted acetyltransferase|nr:GNAT family N-acetyltransferase [Scytonematopsis contorta HA4267-MV1]
MHVEILAAPLKDKPLIQQMMELYQYDMSEFERSDLNEHGLFGYLYLDYYWVEKDRHPFIVRVDGKLAGFVLVNRYVYIPGNQYSIGEFFILRKYRQKGIGKKVAFHVFDLFYGKWEVQQIITNTTAQKFWRSVIREYTAGKFQEIVEDNDIWKGTTQCFNNTDKIK